MGIPPTENQLVTSDSSGSVPSQLASSPFRGSFAHNVDDKGRVSLPAAFRSALDLAGDTKVILTNYVIEGARCIDGYGLSGWVAFEEQLRKKSRFDAQLQKLENFYLSRAAECPLDSAGRILIPNNLRVYAGIEREVTFTSSLYGFRVWDSRAWNVIFQAAESAMLSDPNIFSGIDTPDEPHAFKDGAENTQRRRAK